MKIGYARCSTVDQNPARQQEILKLFGCEKIYIDMLSGKDTNRPQLKEMLEYARNGDEVYVESISRLARSTKDLLAIIEQLSDKGVRFISQKENFDTSTPQGKFTLTMFAAISELEREQILQRQKEGIAIAKANGVYKGRQSKKVDRIEFEDLYKRWKSGDITQSYMCKRLKVGRTTLWKLIKSYEAGTFTAERSGSATKKKKKKKAKAPEPADPGIVPGQMSLDDFEEDEEELDSFFDGVNG